MTLQWTAAHAAFDVSECVEVVEHPYRWSRGLREGHGTCTIWFDAAQRRFYRRMRESLGNVTWAWAAVCPEPVASQPVCPECGTELRAVTNDGGYLNDDQFDSVRAGDWYCFRCPGNGRGRSGYRYYWDREVVA
jgi:hypothetical protein